MATRRPKAMRRRLAALTAVASSLTVGAAGTTPFTGDAGRVTPRSDALAVAAAAADHIYIDSGGAVLPAAHAGATVAPRGGTGRAQSVMASAGPRHGKPALPWQIGFARESLDPTQAMLDSGEFHLGGYGLGPTRRATGPLVHGDGTTESIAARAMAITSTAGGTLLLAGIENQGTFAAYKQGPYGLYDIRVEVSHDTGVPVDMIVINSDHSHAGPDLIGLWGGVPVSYLQLVHDQTVKALDEAFRNRVAADLLVGSSVPTMPDPTVGGYIKGTATPGEDLVHSQFSADTQTGYRDDLVDTQLRVLQAVDGSGKPLGTLINYAAHATVMGSGNTRYSADWPGSVATATEQALGEPVALTMVADVGRSQPPRPHSDAKCDSAGHPSCDVDQLDTYTHLLLPWVLSAVNSALPVTGSGAAGSEVFTREAASNPALLGVSATGEVPLRGFGAYRAATPPWLTGNLIGTFASVHRLGDVLLTANPGEAYPDVRFGVIAEMKTQPQALFTFGLANDQLGYLIAPTTEYGWITTSNVGNDNSFFNVAPQYGDHLMCTHAALAAALGFGASGTAQPYGPDAPAPNCALLTASDAIPMGPAPQQPWPFGDGVTLPPPAPQ